MFQFQPVYNLNRDGSVCNLFKLNQKNLLFDCGFDELKILDFEEHSLKLKTLIEEILFNNEKIDYIFISDCSLRSFGYLPYIIKFFPECEIFSSTPIAKIGYFMLLDYLTSYVSYFNFDFFNEEDIFFAFSNIEEYTFNSNINLFNGELIITPYSNGHTIGGITWKIKYLLKNIIYSPFLSLDKIINTKPFQYDDIVNPYLFISDYWNFDRINEDQSINKHLSLNKFNSFIVNYYFSISNRKHLFFPCETVFEGLELLSLIRGIILKIEDDNSLLMENKQVLPNKRNFYMILFGNYVGEIDESIKSLSNWTEDNFKHHNCDLNEENRHTVTNQNEYNVIMKGFNSYVEMSNYLKEIYDQMTVNLSEVERGMKIEKENILNLFDILLSKGHNITFITFTNGIFCMKKWDILVELLLSSNQVVKGITFPLKDKNLNKKYNKSLSFDNKVSNSDFIYLLKEKFYNSSCNMEIDNLMSGNKERNYHKDYQTIETILYNREILNVSKIEEDSNVKDNSNEIKDDQIDISEQLNTDEAISIEKDYNCINSFNKNSFHAFTEELKFIPHSEFGIDLTNLELKTMKKYIQIKEVESEFEAKETVFKGKNIFYKSNYFSYTRNIQFDKNSLININLNINYPNIHNNIMVLKGISSQKIILLGITLVEIKSQLDNSNRYIFLNDFPCKFDMSSIYSSYFPAQIDIFDSSFLNISYNREKEKDDSTFESVSFLKIKRKENEIKVCSNEEVIELINTNVNNGFKNFTYMSVDNHDHIRFPHLIKLKKKENLLNFYMRKQEDNQYSHLVDSNLKIISDNQLKIGKTYIDMNDKEISIKSRFGLEYFQIREKIID